METTLLNELVAVRQSMCLTRHLCIDTINGTAKGYTKAKNFHSNKLKDKSTAEVTEKQTNHKPHELSHLSHGVFKFLGVDYVG